MKDSKKHKKRRKQISYQRQNIIEVHSTQARRLIYGVKAVAHPTPDISRQVVGLYTFAKRTHDLLFRVSEDNPYIDKMLIKLEWKLSAAEACLEDIDQLISMKEHLLPDNYSAPIVASRKPLRLSVDFKGNPYANWCARLIATYDTVMRRIETCRSLAMISRTDNKALRYKASQKLRSAMNFSLETKIPKVSREYIALHPETIEQLSKDYGAMNIDIIEKRRLPEFGIVPMQANTLDTGNSSLIDVDIDEIQFDSIISFEDKDILFQST